MRGVSYIFIVLLIIGNVQSFKFFKRHAQNDEPSASETNQEQAEEEGTYNRLPWAQGFANRLPWLQEYIAESQEGSPDGLVVKEVASEVGGPTEHVPRHEAPMLDLPFPWPLGYGQNGGRLVTPDEKELPGHPTGILAKLRLPWPIGYGVGPLDGPLELPSVEEKALRELLPYPIGSKNGGRNDPLFLSPDEEQAIMDVLPWPVGSSSLLHGGPLELSSEQVQAIRDQFEEAVERTIEAQKNLKEEARGNNMRFMGREEQASNYRYRYKW